MKDKKNKVKERFVFGNRIFVYDFNNITVEAAEIISAIAELKYNQIQSPPTAFRQVLVSGGAEWKILIAACLLLEEKDGVLMPFDKDKALDDVANFVRNMPVAELERIDRCITDFFYNTDFNTNIVRLEPFRHLHHRCCRADFNTNIVRLELLT